VDAGYLGMARWGVRLRVMVRRRTVMRVEQEEANRQRGRRGVGVGRAS